TSSSASFTYSLKAIKRGSLASTNSTRPGTRARSLSSRPGLRRFVAMKINGPCIPDSLPVTSPATIRVSEGPAPAGVCRMSDLGGEVDALASGTGFSGVVRIDQNDRMELARAYGLAHRGFEIPNTVDTRFGLASGAKGFTALAVVRL